MSETKTVPKKCPDKCCINSDIQREDGLLVCINCGQLCNSSTDQLTNDPTQEYNLNCRSDDIKSYVANNKHFPHRFPVAKRHNTEDVDRLVYNLSLGADVRIQAISKYKDMIDGHFRHSSKQTKLILAAICIYTSLVEDKTPVTIGHICNTIGCSASEFNKVYNQVIKEYPNYRCEQMPIESLVSVTISETRIDEKEKKKICEKVKKILDLERECWLIEGRTPVHIIFAATFLAWKSIEPYNRRKVKLTEFCRTVGIEYKHTTSQRVTELFNAIKTLAANSPLPKEIEITKSNIGIYLDNILEYKSSLVYDFNQKFKKDGNGLCLNSEVNPYVKPNNWMNFFKRKLNNSEFRPKDSGICSQSSADSSKADEDFSDSEIDIYLRDEKEIKYIKKLKKFADYCEDESNP